MYIEPSVNSLVTLAAGSSNQNSNENSEISFGSLLNSLCEGSECSTQESSNVLIEDLIMNLKSSLLQLLGDGQVDVEKSDEQIQKEETDLVNLLMQLPAESLNEIKELVIEVQEKISTVLNNEGLGNANKDMIEFSNLLKGKPQLMNNNAKQILSDFIKENFNVVSDSDGNLQNVSNLKAVISKMMVDPVINMTDDTESLIQTDFKIPETVMQVQVNAIKKEFAMQLKSIISEVKAEEPAEKGQILKGAIQLHIRENKGNQKNVGTVVEKIENYKAIEKIHGKSQSNSEEFAVFVENKGEPIEMTTRVEGSLQVSENQFEIIDQIIDRVDIEKLESGQIISVKLKPDSLGTISLKVEFGVDSIKAEIVTDNNQVRQIISENVNELSTALSEKGIKADTIKVTHNENISTQLDFSGESSREMPEDNQNMHRWNYMMRNVTDSKEDESVDELIKQNYGGLVNIYV